MTGFEQLTAHEMAVLKSAPSLVALLVGGADGELDREEKIWASKITHARTYSKPEALQDFYEPIAATFFSDLKRHQAAMPTDAGLRNALISSKLSELNPILAKLENRLAAGYYRSLKSLAEEVAKASGGFLRIGAVSVEEHQWVSLPMILPVESAALQAELEADFKKEDAEKDINH